MPNPWPKAIVAEMRVKYVEGTISTLKEIAKKYGVNHGNLRHMAHREGWAKMRKARYLAGAAKLAQVAPPPQTKAPTDSEGPLPADHLQRHFRAHYAALDTLVSIEGKLHTEIEKESPNIERIEILHKSAQTIGITSSLRQQILRIPGPPRPGSIRAPSSAPVAVEPLNITSTSPTAADLDAAAPGAADQPNGPDLDAGNPATHQDD